MLSFYRNLVNKDLNRFIKLYKHSKLKCPSKSFKTFCRQPNLANIHVAFLNNFNFKTLQTSTDGTTKLYMNTENVYAYNILQTIPIIDKNLHINKSPKRVISTLDDFNDILDQNWRSRTVTEIVDCFKSVCNYCVQNNIDVSDQRFDKLVDGLVDHVQDLTDSELLELLGCLTEYPLCYSYASHNFHDIWSALDDVCIWKMPNWSNETMFMCADRWYLLGLGKLSDFVFNFIDRMQNRLKHLTKDEVVHLFFYLRIHKRQKLVFQFEQILYEFIADMSLKEISIAATAFIRQMQTMKLRTTVSHMINKLQQDIPNADEVCVRRIVEVSKVGKYVLEFLKRQSRTPNRLTKAQLIHIFFYLNVCRDRYADFFENALQNHIHTFNADEMAIVALGFFKTQSTVKVKFFLPLMIGQIRKECQTLHEITLTALLKVLRYSSHVLLIDQLMDLLDQLVPEIDRLSNLCCVHMALLGTTLLFFHKASLEKISEKLVKHINDPDEIRLKDIERLLVALTMFDFNPNTHVDIYEAVFKEIHTENRRKEFVKYTRCMPVILNLLAMRKMYSYDLISEHLCRDRILEIYGKAPKLLSRDLLSLDVCIEIECPDYKGNRIDKTFRQRATKWMVEYTPTWDQFKKLKASDKFYLVVQDTVTRIVGDPKNVHTDHILPNFVKSDIIICKNKSGQFVQPSGFENYMLGDVMYVPKPDLKWYAIIPVSWNNVIRNTTIPLGSVTMKYRLLKAVGYEPILIHWAEFSQLNENEKIEYIKSRIT